MKKIYLIHGWGGSDSSAGWFGWLKEKAKEKGFEFKFLFPPIYFIWPLSSLIIFLI